MTSPHANWLSGQDVTTVATDRLSATTPRPKDLLDTSTSRVSRLTGPTAALTFLAAVWLAMASFPLYFTYEAQWNDVVMGAAIAAVSLARIAKPVETRSLGWVNIVLGMWLLVAPFVWTYGSMTGSAPAVGNDIAVGLFVVLLSGVGLLPARTGSDRSLS
jgi:hypothetical protein